MTTRTVTTQTELNKALADKITDIYIESPAGVWLELRGNGSSRVVARGSSSVVAWESSRVVARESSRVVARESSRVVARESSRVVARESSSVVARESSSVVARESSSVVAWESSSVVARESSRVVARESSRVVAWESSRVEASSYVAVHLHSALAKVRGGVLIDITKIDLNDPATWCEFHGVKVARGKAVLFKAVNDDLRSGHGFEYPIGKTVTAPDWRADGSCGGGLHLSPSPAGAQAYHSSATRFLACQVTVKTMCPINDGGPAKVKVESLKVLREVDIHGDAVQS